MRRGRSRRGIERPGSKSSSRRQRREDAVLQLDRVLRSEILDVVEVGRGIQRRVEAEGVGARLTAEQVRSAATCQQIVAGAALQLVGEAVGVKVPAGGQPLLPALAASQLLDSLSREGAVGAAVTSRAVSSRPAACANSSGAAER